MWSASIRLIPKDDKKVDFPGVRIELGEKEKFVRLLSKLNRGYLTLLDIRKWNTKSRFWVTFEFSVPKVDENQGQN